LLGLFGLDVQALYLAHIFVIFLCAVVVYFLARRLFSGYKFLALPAALLFLVFPVDLTRMWLSMNYIWINYLAALIVLYLMLDYAEKGGIWKLAVSLPLIILPLGAYEGQIGLVLAWSILLAVITRRISLWRRLLLLYPIAIAGLFIFWRTYVQPVVLNIHDPYMGFQSNQRFIPLLITRLIAIIPVFVNCWILPFSSLLGISARRVLLILGGAVACIGLLVLWVSKEPDSSSERSKADSHDLLSEPSNPEAVPADQLTWRKKKQESIRLLVPFGIGVIMLLAGYFPYIIIVSPSLEWFGSRGNMFAIFGAALALSSAVALIGLWVIQQRSQMRFIIITAMIPLILIGATEQIWNQNEARQAWAEQKHFWRALFKEIPNLRDGTTVVVVMPYDNPSRPFQRLPFTADWELTGGLKLLYNNASLRAIPYTPNHVEGNGYATLTPEGVWSNNFGLTPYDDIVFVYYVQGSYVVRRVDQVNADIPLKFTVTGYTPEKHILPDPPRSNPYRGLVLQ
jgi:hypothetical protein